jgi:2-polyprenyl-3-methyl-5-hydroxy-6-metoxy-1,4-benzoquinol methylase
MECRSCKTELHHVFVDLFNSPASNSFVKKEELNEPEIFFPLKVYTCHKCFLVQVDEYKKSDAIFTNEYVYFSSYSTSWLDHSKKYVDLMTNRFGLSETSQVMEIASNDGYLLQYFKKKGIPVLGIEPTANTAKVAIEMGIESLIEFFGRELATKLKTQNRKADLLLGNNVLAHVPDIVDFVAGMKIVLKDQGIITMEFPHLLQLIENNQFDTIYHEHFSYLSFTTVTKIFAEQGLEMFDVDELSTHGGSLRIYAKHKEDNTKKISENVSKMLEFENHKGINTLEYYKNFQLRALDVKLNLLSFLIEQKRKGKKVAAYGAAAKGNTLLNYCGIKSDMIDFVVDANPHKQGKYLPASHIPVLTDKYLKEAKPDYILILPWNLKEEIVNQLNYVRSWGAQFVVPIPTLEVV